MEEFAILHHTAKGQILVIKQYLPEDDVYELKIMFPLKEAIGDISVKIETEETCNALFEGYKDEDKVMTVLENTLQEAGIEF